jgi:hypothetical protein
MKANQRIRKKLEKEAKYDSIAAVSSDFQQPWQVR